MKQMPLSLRFSDSAQSQSTNSHEFKTDYAGPGAGCYLEGGGCCCRSRRFTEQYSDDVAELGRRDEVQGCAAHVKAASGAVTLRAVIGAKLRERGLVGWADV